MADPTKSLGQSAGDTFDSIERISATAFNDMIWGDANANTFFGKDGNDMLDGRAGDDVLEGDGGNDTIFGGDGADTLYGNDGNDILYGGIGNDGLYGGAGDDQLYAESGDDYLDGGTGNDVLNGGLDNDTYIISRSSDADTIVNYDPSGNDIDVIGFQDAAKAINDQDLWFEHIGSDMKISVIGTNSSATIKDWYVISDPTSRANYKIDFIIAGTRYSRTINVEGLVTLMAGITKPATEAARDTLLADTNYRAQWATYWQTNAAPTLSTITAQTINEDAVLNLTVTATDDITPAGGVLLTAQILSGAGLFDLTDTIPDMVFGAADASGQHSFQVIPKANASGTATIAITATDAGGISTTRQFTLTVNAVADTPTINQFISSGGTSGNTPIAIALNVNFPDTDGSEIQDIVITGVPANATLSAGTRDPVTGAWKLLPSQTTGLMITVPAGSSQDLTLTAIAHASEVGQTATSNSITTTIVVNTPPTNVTFSGSVNENTAINTVIGQLVGVDPDTGDTLTYALIDSAGGRFAVSTTGQLRVNDGTLLNYEAATSHTITARVTDSFGQYIDKQIVVPVNDANEANSLPLNYDLNVDENLNNGIVGTVAATDLDSSTVAFGQQRYYFKNGPSVMSATSSDGRFTIDAVTGAIKTVGKLDYETPNLSMTPTFTVVARDNAASSTATTGFNEVETAVKILINNKNDQVGMPAAQSFAVNENVNAGTSVGKLQFSDQDSSSFPFGQQHFYFSYNGAFTDKSYDGRYVVDAATGTISTNNSLDFESFNSSRPYTMVVQDNIGPDGQPQSGSTQATSVVTIAIANVNEAPDAPDGPTSVFLDETGLGTNPASPGGLVASYKLTDPDKTTPTLIFATPDANPTNFANLFNIQGNGVYLNPGVSFDFEWYRDLGYGWGDYDGDGRIEAHVGWARVVTNDGQYSSSATWTNLFIHDINEQANTPVLEASNIFSETFNGGTSHSGLLQARFGLTDPDGPTPQLVITDGNANGWFHVNGNHIQISDGVNFTADWLRANKGQYGTDADFYYDNDGDGLKEIRIASLTVRALDLSGVQSNPLTYNIYIEDVNEAPVFTATSLTMAPSENAGAWQQIGTATATDVDGPSGELRYRFADAAVTYNASLNRSVSTSADGRFVIDEATGTVFVNGAQTLDYEGTRSFTNAIRVYDRNAGANSLATNGTLTVNLQDVNEPHSLSDKAVNVNETTFALGPLIPVQTNTGATINLRTLMLYDPEGHNMRWQFDNGTVDNGAWHVEQDGTLRLNGVIDFETTPVMNLGIRAIDDSSGIVAGGTLTVNLQNVNESPMPTFPSSIIRFSGGGARGWILGSITPNDPDAGDHVTYSVASVENWDYGYGDTNSYLVSADGLVTLNHASYGGYRNTDDVTIAVADAAGATGYVNLRITYNMNAPNPPIILDLDGDGIELVPLATSTVSTDVDLDGVAEKTDDGFLALDRNGDGIVTDMSELSFASDVPDAVSDLEGLRAFDTNGDGFLDEGDARFGDFKIWRDMNQDGISQSDELFSLETLNIAAINLQLNLTGDDPATASDNVIYATSQFIRSDGSTGNVGDVFLRYNSGISDPVATPIIVNWNGDQTEYITLGGSAVRFDMNGDGTADRTSWAQAVDAFLAIDRNGNGLIDDISEISFVGDKVGARTDLEGLAGLDSNGDDLLTADDDRYVELRLWFDRNSNGVTDAGELLSLQEAGIGSIDLKGDGTPSAADQDGTTIYNHTILTKTNGDTVGAVDIGLAYRPSALSGASDSEADPLPTFALQSSSYSRKFKKYRIDSHNGALFIGDPNHKGAFDTNAGQISPASILTFRNARVGLLSTVIIDLDGDGAELRDRKKSHAMFDMDGDGVVDDTGWAWRDDALLVIDRNGDGKITDASELSLLSEKPGARSGFDALSALDSNKDGKISTDDTRFGELKIWHDSNDNGVTDDGELKTLAEVGIASIGLTEHGLDASAKPGKNLMLGTASFTRADGRTGTVGDAVLAFTPSSHTEVAPQPSALSFASQLDAMKAALAVAADGASATIATTGTDDQRIAQMVQAMASFGAVGADATSMLRSNLLDTQWATLAAAAA
jgi:hypothetical protein